MIGAKIKGSTVIRGEVVSRGDSQFTKREKEAEEFLKTALEGAEITNIQNSAKFILTETTKQTILTHLGFTGWWIPIEAPVHRPKKFTHTLKEENYRFILHTTKGDLKYLDPRLLGRNRLYINKEEALLSRHLKNLAPEADTEEGRRNLLLVVKKTGRKIRDVLLDQKILSGIGNYLVCEILFEAKIHGATKAKTLTDLEIERITAAIQSCINKASIIEDRSWWQVFQRSGKPCYHCGTTIVREVWTNRGNYTCPCCQTSPKDWKPLIS
jgi:formamidopyrimidine-DNA glycosylase